MIMAKTQYVTELVETPKRREKDRSTGRWVISVKKTERVSPFISKRMHALKATNIRVYSKGVKAAYHHFVKESDDILNITSEAKYKKAMATLESLCDSSDPSDQTNEMMIKLLTDAIENYESSLEGVAEFEKDVDKLNPGLSMLRLLMSQHGLKNKDLKDVIGSESLVSMILKGDRELTKKHIENLSTHFDINPAVFF